MIILGARFHVTLKVIKRMMFGSNNFDLLRHRIDPARRLTSEITEVSQNPEFPPRTLEARGGGLCTV